MNESTITHKRGESIYRIKRTESGNMLAVYGPDKPMFDGEEHTTPEGTYKLCPLSAPNSKIIRKLFDFTNPISSKGHDATFGLGDRLGIASAGHIRLIRDTDIFPILAQQSIRELNLTNRTFDDVLAAAVWAVFREGYTKGYGADGDHLKTHDEVRHALDCGYTMITLDCSEQIRNDIPSMPQSEVDAHYAALATTMTSTLESRYLGKSFPLGDGMAVEFSADELKRIALVYLNAIDHAVQVYFDFIKPAGADFEVSIDETLQATSPQAHYFVASELSRQGVVMMSLAPRFIGEFQKGIDYLGDVSVFERDFLVHAKIAEEFGYRISVHSASDKFSIYPIVGKLTGGRYHIKTAGTNWLEALRVIAEQTPCLYREIHAFALLNLHEAKRYYHTTENVINIADLDSVSDAHLHDYLDQEDARQALHITFGLVLSAKSEDGTPLFREKIYQTLHKHEAMYFTALQRHIGKHLNLLKQA